MKLEKDRLPQKKGQVFGDGIINKSNRKIILFGLLPTTFEKFEVFSFTLKKLKSG